MSFDIVRGNIVKMQPAKSLEKELVNIFSNNRDNGTLYLGYPLSANSDSKITVDALLISEEKGLIAFIFPENFSDIDIIKEEQDELYYQLDYNFKKYNTLRKGRGLAFQPNVITMFPDNNLPDTGNDYLVSDDESLKDILERLSDFDSNMYSRICEALQRVSNIKPRKKRENVVSDISRGGIIKKIEKEIANLDQWQKKAALEIPEGPQRIRGLAGSGKTVVLALKAAYLHSQNPDWKIAITYYTRALFQQYRDLIRQFSFEFSGDEPNWDNIHIIHAWGTSQEVGMYSVVANALNVTPHNYTSAKQKYGRINAFEGVCSELLGYADNLKELYDVILIDEAQDLPTSFFKIVYKSTKNPKRITWAYDELQNLNETAMPSLEEMFGRDKDGNLNINLQSNDDEAKKDIILPICYRNPAWTLAIAHSLGFGVYKENLVQMFSDFKLWEDIGYRLESGRLEYGKNVILTRKIESTPKYFEELLKPEDSIYSKVFNTTTEQYNWIATEIQKNITEDELDPDDILVIFPNAYYSRQQYIEFRTFLMQKGIDSVLVGVNTDKEIFRKQGCVSCSGIYRAKGNESPMVYIANSEFCADGIELIKLRNTLFTAITRSRAWVRICGVGSNMELLSSEIKKCIDNSYKLDFKLPTESELNKMRRINRERTEEEVKKINSAQKNLQELIAGVEAGELDPELIPEMQALMNLLNSTKKSNKDEEEY